MEAESNNFTGRHQLALEAGKLLGYEFSPAELQEAAGKDITEHALILKTAEQIAEDIKSGDLKHAYGALDVHERVRKVLGEGYQNCVLSFDSKLEEALLQILDSAAEILVASSNGKATKEGMDKMKNLTLALEGMQYPSMGGLVATGNEKGMLEMPVMQKAWFIYSLLNSPNKLQLTFLLGDKSDLAAYGNEIRRLSSEMLAKKTISTEEFELINDNYETLLGQTA